MRKKKRCLKSVLPKFEKFYVDTSKDIDINLLHNMNPIINFILKIPGRREYQYVRTLGILEIESINDITYTGFEKKIYGNKR